ncbi:hypothetical protein LCGC14_2504580, partial [marine sediment metagenome]
IHVGKYLGIREVLNFERTIGDK